MGHQNGSMLVTVYAAPTRHCRESGRIWEGMENMEQNVPDLRHKLAA